MPPLDVRVVRPVRPFGSSDDPGVHPRRKRHGLGGAGPTVGRNQGTALLVSLALAPVRNCPRLRVSAALMVHAHILNAL
jgi:hypothetical protein